MHYPGRALAEDLEADLTRVMKLHQFVQVVSAACRTLAALAGLMPKVRVCAPPICGHLHCMYEVPIKKKRVNNMAAERMSQLLLRTATHCAVQVGNRLAATAAAVAEKMAGPASKGANPGTYLAKLQSPGTNAKELRVRRMC